MQNVFADDAITNLHRLSQKKGVQSTLILSRETGAIVQSSGLESRDDSADAGNVLPRSNNGIANEHDVVRSKSAEDVARIVFNFVQAAGGMAQELNDTQDDELKLLRLRTKKNELVIVPDAKYIAVVIHDTPPA